MKRSEKLFAQAWEYGWMSALVLMASVAIVCWVPMSVLSGARHPGGMVLTVGMGTFALIGLTIGVNLAAEALRLTRLANRECRYEWEREVRPKL